MLSESSSMKAANSAIVLSKAFDEQSDTLGPVRAYRRLKHERLQRKLFQAERTARLRSGARGYDARKELIAVEKEVSDAEALYDCIGLVFALGYG